MPLTDAQQPVVAHAGVRSTQRSAFHEPGHGPQTGSGVLVSPDGYVLTTAHGLAGAAEIRVTLADRRTMHAQLVGTDLGTDVAVLKLPGTGFPALPLGDSARLQVAEPVVAIGHPFGLTYTVTRGIVSALGRANVGLTDYEDYIQTDAAINPGNSGGALLNACGELVGLTTALLSASGSALGVGFAVPSNLVRTVFEQLLAHRRVRRGWLGVVVQELTPALARGLRQPEIAGLIVSDVAAGSPAAQAGLRREDLIIRYDDTPVDEVGQFRNLVAHSLPGSRRTLTMYRGGQEHRLDVLVGEQQESLAQEKTADAELHHLGVELVDLDLALTRQLGLPLPSHGAVVVDVLPGSTAETAGLQVGDVMQEVNRQRVQSVRDFARAVERAESHSLVLFILRNRTTLYLVLESWHSFRLNHDGVSDD
ncbi:MAG TPA: trypsin-like peptidase domain-containing protein [Candidatus Tectomicrobia bacterium]